MKTAWFVLRFAVGLHAFFVIWHGLGLVIGDLAVGNTKSGLLGAASLLFLVGVVLLASFAREDPRRRS